MRAGVATGPRAVKLIDSKGLNHSRFIAWLFLLRQRAGPAAGGPLAPLPAQTSAHPANSQPEVALYRHHGGGTKGDRPPAC
jgi:hypothetical protein